MPGRLSNTSIRRCLVRGQRRRRRNAAHGTAACFLSFVFVFVSPVSDSFTNEPPTIEESLAPRRPACCELSGFPIRVTNRPTILRRRKIPMKQCASRAVFPNHALLSGRRSPEKRIMPQNNLWSWEQTHATTHLVELMSYPASSSAAGLPC